MARTNPIARQAFSTVPAQKARPRADVRREATKCQADACRSEWYARAEGENGDDPENDCRDKRYVNPLRARSLPLGGRRDPLVPTVQQPGRHRREPDEGEGVETHERGVAMSRAAPERAVPAGRERYRCSPPRSRGSRLYLQRAPNPYVEPVAQGWLDEPDEKTAGAQSSSWASPMRSPSGPRM
jgi:hypothetical protein